MVDLSKVCRENKAKRRKGVRRLNLDICNDRKEFTQPLLYLEMLHQTFVMPVALPM